jgi:hypothetical protein
VYAVLTAATNGAYHLLSMISAFDGELRPFAQSSAAGVLGYFVFPLAFAFLAFGYAGRAVSFLLGKAIEREHPLVEATGVSLLAIGVQLLGLYFVIDSGAACVSHVIEHLMTRVKDDGPRNFTALADATYSFAGLAGGLILLFKASAIARAVARKPGTS